MSFGWKRITANVWRLDDTWQVVEERPGCWRAYRGDAACLAEFQRADLAMDEAEKLRKADKPYAEADRLKKELENPA